MSFLKHRLCVLASTFTCCGPSFLPYWNEGCFNWFLIQYSLPYWSSRPVWTVLFRLLRHKSVGDCILWLQTSYPVSLVMPKLSITFKVYCKCSTFYDQTKKNVRQQTDKYNLTAVYQNTYPHPLTLIDIICIWLPCCALKDGFTIFQVCLKTIVRCPYVQRNKFCLL